MAIEGTGVEDLTRTGTSPITAYPFSVGAWVFPTQVGSNDTAFFCIGGASSHFHRVGQPLGNSWLIGTAAGGAASNANAGVGSLVANTWHYVIGRFISNTNRRISAMLQDGSIVHAQNTTNLTPTITTMVVGARIQGGAYSQHFRGSIAEMWICSADVQADTGQLNDNTLRQLAYGGPFTNSRVMNNLVEYRSFRTMIEGADQIGESWWVTQPQWSAAGGGGSFITAPHPPLPYWHASDEDFVRKMLVG